MSDTNKDHNPETCKIDHCILCYVDSPQYQGEPMKTLPEILKRAIVTSFIRGSSAHDLHEYSNEWDESLRWAHDIEGEKAQEAIAKELMGCLPESLNIEKLYSESESYRSSRQPDIDNGYNQAIDEVRARLTAFIGKEK